MHGPGLQTWRSGLCGESTPECGPCRVSAHRLPGIH